MIIDESYSYFQSIENLYQFISTVSGQRLLVQNGMSFERAKNVWEKEAQTLGSVFQFFSVGFLEKEEKRPENRLFDVFFAE